jgi:hypothetical protein
MTAITRMALLDLRTVAPYRRQGLVLFALVAVLFANKSAVTLVPALVLLVTSQVAAYPFLVADKAGLETLYAVLPLPRRSVLYGHYAWAIASFLATAAAGTALALVFARAKAAPFGEHTLATVLAVSWALFAVNVAIQFPLFIRFGYSRISVLGTTVPLAVITLAVVRLHLTMTSVETWVPLLWPAGVAAIAISATVAMSVDGRR